jgi:hypothetical protein
MALPANLARRNFLAGGLAALGLGASAMPAAAQAASEKTRIDVHHHYVPSVQGAAMAKHGGQAPKWSLQSSLADMDKAGVTTAVLSLPPPGVWFGDVEEGRSLARACNEHGAQLRRDNPGRFGLFAAIPLPDTEASLREIAYALDVLKADGIGLYTSYSEKYLGDEAFVPVFEELNRRNAMVYTHPVNPTCCSHLADGVGPSSIEFATDTTRTIASLIFGKAAHAGRAGAGRAEILLRDRPGQRARSVRGAVEARTGVATAVRLRLSLSRSHRGGERACRLPVHRCRARLHQSRNRAAPDAKARLMPRLAG